jgi:hypothetical protein
MKYMILENLDHGGVMVDYVVLEKAKKVVLIWDLSYGVEHAKRMAEENNTVYYYTEWPETSPRFQKYAIGLGIEGIHKIKKFFNFIDKADLIMFIEIGRGDEAAWLRKKGYTVYGAGRGERLETDRGWAMELHRQLGLPVPNYKIIKGVDNTIKYLEKSNVDKIVKTNLFRGDISSFDASDLAIAKLELSNARAKLGPWDQDFKFIVVDKVRGVETGWDLFFNGHDFLKPSLWGYAGVGRYYVGHWVERMPDVLEDIKDRIRPILENLDYRGAISMEVIIDKDKKPYVIDWTTRFFYTGSFVYTYSLKNYSDVMFACAEGRDIRIEPRDPFVGTLHFESEYNMTNWMAISFPGSMRDRIKLRHGSRRKGEFYSVPTVDSITGAVVGSGKSWKSVVEDMAEICGRIKGHDIGEEDPLLGTKKIEEAIDQGRKVGLEFE